MPESQTYGSQPTQPNSDIDNLSDLIEVARALVQLSEDSTFRSFLNDWLSGYISVPALLGLLPKIVPRKEDLISEMLNPARGLGLKQHIMRNIDIDPWEPRRVGYLVRGQTRAQQLSRDGERDRTGLTRTKLGQKQGAPEPVGTPIEVLLNIYYEHAHKWSLEVARLFCGPGCSPDSTLSVELLGLLCHFAETKGVRLLFDIDCTKNAKQLSVGTDGGCRSGGPFLGFDKATMTIGFTFPWERLIALQHLPTPPINRLRIHQAYDKETWNKVETVAPQTVIDKEVSTVPTANGLASSEGEQAEHEETPPSVSQRQIDHISIREAEVADLFDFSDSSSDELGIHLTRFSSMGPTVPTGGVGKEHKERRPNIELPPTEGPSHPVPKTSHPPLSPMATTRQQTFMQVGRLSRNVIVLPRGEPVSRPQPPTHPLFPTAYTSELVEVLRRKPYLRLVLADRRYDDYVKLLARWAEQRVLLDIFDGWCGDSSPSVSSTGVSCLSDDGDGNNQHAGGGSSDDSIDELLAFDTTSNTPSSKATSPRMDELHFIEQQVMPSLLRRTATKTDVELLNEFRYFATPAGDALLARYRRDALGPLLRSAGQSKDPRALRTGFLKLVKLFHSDTIFRNGRAMCANVTRTRSLMDNITKALNDAYARAAHQ